MRVDGNTLVLLCYATGREGEWQAFCPDFDLAVQGRSYREVSEELDQAIREYLEYVDSLPEDEQAAFVNRRAPLRVRLFMGICALLSMIFRDQGGRDGQHRKQSITKSVEVPSHAHA